MQAVQTAGPALIMAAGGYLVITGHTTVGTVFVFATVLSARLAGSVGALATMHVNVVGSLALFQRLFEYIDLPPQITDSPAAHKLADADGAIRFENVTFAYPHSKRPALADVTIDIGAGQLAALVGPSGAGKTTLTSLVARFADPQTGQVLLDGNDLRDLTLESLGRLIGMVFQDTFLFHASLADNLRYAKPEATDAELADTAKAAFRGSGRGGRVRVLCVGGSASTGRQADGQLVLACGGGLGGGGAQRRNLSRNPAEIQSGFVVGAAEPAEQFGVNLRWVCNAYSVGNHGVPPARLGQAISCGTAL
jgi:ABC transporter